MENNMDVRPSAGTSGTKFPKGSDMLLLSKPQKKIFINSFDFVFMACDGVIWHFNEPIPNIGPAIMKLKNANKQCKFVSNNSMRSDDEYLRRINKMGVRGVIADDIVHPVKTITRYLKRNMPGEVFFSLCCNEVNDILLENEINIKIADPMVNLTIPELVGHLKNSEKVCAVILDLNFNLSYFELAKAQRYLQDDKCCFLVGSTDEFMPISKSFLTLGTAGFMNLLRESTGKEPIILGKPGALLAADLVELYEVKVRSRVLFVGHNIATDIRFGISSGFQTLFVQTGIENLDVIRNLGDRSKPDFCARSLADFITFFAELDEE